MLKRTLLYNAHLALHAKIVHFAGWEMPVSYKGIIEEHNAVRASTGIFDIGHMGLLKLEGEGVLSLLQKLCTNDISKIAPDECEYSVICNEEGGVIDDVFVYHLPSFYLVICNASNTDKVVAWFDQEAQGKPIFLSLFESCTLLAVQGPAAEKSVVEILKAPLSGLEHNHSLLWQEIIFSRTGYTGEDGFELIVPKSMVEKIWGSFVSTGVQPCGLGARDTLRLEAGYPLYGHEYDEKTSPLEAGYSWAVNFSKGDFVGRAALFKQKELGVKKKLVGIEVVGRVIPRAGDSILTADGAKCIGQVTSGTFSPTFKLPIALVYLPAGEASLGKNVLVEIRGKQIPAKTVAKTFYKR